MGFRNHTSALENTRTVNTRYELMHCGMERPDLTLLPPAACSFAPCSHFSAPCPVLPALCFLLPAPCSLLAVPCSLLPAPCSLLPAPDSLVAGKNEWRKIIFRKQKWDQKRVHYTDPISGRKGGSRRVASGWGSKRLGRGHGPTHAPTDRQGFAGRLFTRGPGRKAGCHFCAPLASTKWSPAVSKNARRRPQKRDQFWGHIMGPFLGSENGPKSGPALVFKRKH